MFRKYASEEGNEDGQWVTVNGNHILIKEGQSLEDAFKEKTGKSLTTKEPDSEIKYNTETIKAFDELKSSDKKGIDFSIISSEDFGTMINDEYPDISREIAGKEIAGVYDPDNKRIRINARFRFGQDKHFTHEIGHHIDNLRGGKSDEIFASFLSDEKFMRSAVYSMGSSKLDSGHELFAQGFSEMVKSPGYWESNTSKPHQRKTRQFFDAVQKYSGYYKIDEYRDKERMK